MKIKPDACTSLFSYYNAHTHSPPSLYLRILSPVPHLRISIIYSAYFFSTESSVARLFRFTERASLLYFSLATPTARAALSSFYDFSCARDAQKRRQSRAPELLLPLQRPTVLTTPTIDPGSALVLCASREGSLSLSEIFLK